MAAFTSLRLRLAAFTAAAVLGCTLVAVGGAWLVRSTHASDARLTADVSAELQGSYAALERLVAVQGALQTLLRLKDADEIEAALARYEKARQDAAAQLGRAGDAALVAGFDQLTATSKEITDRVLLADNGGALELYVNRFNPALDAIQQGLRARNLAAVAASRNGIARHEQTTARALTLSGAAILVLIASLATAGWYFQRAITRTLTRMAGRLDSVAEALALHASSVADGSQSVADGATKQAAALEETGASTTELLSISESAAKNIEQAANEAGLARKESALGESEAQRLNAAMTELHEAGRGVEKIIKSIDEIAFQTNLLALNAAVEAARAGEAGAGFAVVADEVRALAQRSAQAARETSDRIGDSQAKSARGAELSQQLGQQLADIAARSRTVDDLVKELAGSIREQNAGIRQISSAMSQIDQVTQANAASAELSASATQEMAGEVNDLNQTVRELHDLVGAGTVARSPHPAAPALPAAPSHRTPGAVTASV